MREEEAFIPIEELMIEEFVFQETFIEEVEEWDRKSTRLNSSHGYISYAVFCLKKKKKTEDTTNDIIRIIHRYDKI